MEISSFPFTASQDTFNSSFFNLTSSSDFFDPISINATSTTTAAATNSQINLSKRRKRIDHDAISFQDADDSFFELDYLQGQEFNLSPFSFTPEMGQTKPTKDEEETEEQHSRESIKRAPRESVEEVESGEAAAAAAAAAANTGTSQRRLWVKNRSKAWWELCNSPDFPEEEFKKSFRMSKSTFDMICEELESVVTKKDTMLRLAIPVRQRVAVCLWRLATGDPLREVSKRFGLGISTCHKLVLEVCSAIKNVLMPKFLEWPNEEKMREIKREFAMVSGIPNVGGSMHTTHVPIIAPKENVAAYFNKKHTERNQKTSYSITVQGVVDQKGAFTDIFVGWPGSMTDEKVLEHSALYKRANMGLLKDVMIVGNSGYPLMDWVLVPYRKQNLTWTQHALNEGVEVVENVAKEAFMRLKARWKCLQKRTEVKLQDLPVFLGACCVLHNICEKRNEEMSPDLRFDLFDDECVPDNPFRSMTAVKARDQIAHKLLHHNHAGTNFI